MRDNIRPFPKDQQALNTTHGGGSDDGHRLRNVELDVREIKTNMKHVALQKDVLGLKIWVLVGVIGGMITAVSLGIALARLFLTD